MSSLYYFISYYLFNILVYAKDLMFYETDYGVISMIWGHTVRLFLASLNIIKSQFYH